MDFNNKPSRCDSRINASKINAVGTPEKPLSEVASESNEFPMRWDISWAEDNQVVFALFDCRRVGL